MLELACVHLWRVPGDLMGTCWVAHPVPSVWDPVMNEGGRSLPWLWPPAEHPMEDGHEWNNGEVKGGVYSWEFWESSWELMRVGRRRPSGRREMAGVGGLPEQ